MHCRPALVLAMIVVVERVGDKVNVQRDISQLTPPASTKELDVTEMMSLRFRRSLRWVGSRIKIVDDTFSQLNDEDVGEEDFS